MMLTPKQQRFVQEYLVDLNATAAARRAGYSEQTAEQQGYRLLRNVQVAAAVEAAQKARADRVEVTQDYVLRRLVREAEYEGDGSSHSARVQALTQLGKHLKMFTDKVEADHTHLLAVVEEIVDADGNADRPSAPGAG
jgi:phage terminase small subunit